VQVPASFGRLAESIVNRRVRVQEEVSDAKGFRSRRPWLSRAQVRVATRGTLRGVGLALDGRSSEAVNVKPRERLTVLVGASASAGLGPPLTIDVTKRLLEANSDIDCSPRMIEESQQVLLASASGAAVRSALARR
jgi:hypothetical protein